MKENVEVAVGPGRLRGAREDGLVVFRGIPYAAPPTGARRWRPPFPPEAWSRVREATRFAPAPPQLEEPLSRRLGLQGDHPQDEDCLALNVWSPGPERSARRPVLVWLPGGAFALGSTAPPLYDAARLARRGDVVVVTVGYRVGALGFLHLGPGAGANRGLQDQLAALRFVREEIEHFGGDPGNVTVFGESAGAGSVCALLAMPAAAGLFDRAIVQSAAPRGMLAAEEAARRAALFAAELGLAEASAGSLATVPTERVLEAQRALSAREVWDTGMLFAPVVEGDGLPRPPIAAARRGEIHRVPLLIGTTAEEMRLYAGGPFEPADEETACSMLGFQMPGPAEGRDAAARLVWEATRAAREARGESTAPADVYYAVQSDRYLRVPSVELAEAHARHQPRTFMYRFTWRSPMDGGIRGSCHALDLPFTFGRLDAPGMEAFAGGGPAAQRLSERMMDAWCAFARGGDPGHPGLGPWPPYLPPARTTMVLGEECGLRDAPLEAERAAWSAIDWSDSESPPAGPHASSPSG